MPHLKSVSYHTVTDTAPWLLVGRSVITWVNYGRMARGIEMLLGMGVGLGHGHIMLDGGHHHPFPLKIEIEQSWNIIGVSLMGFKKLLWNIKY